LPYLPAVRFSIVDIVGGLLIILMEFDESEDIVRSYIYENGQVLARHDEDQQDRPVYFSLHERLGSFRQILRWDDQM